MFKHELELLNNALEVAPTRTLMTSSKQFSGLYDPDPSLGKPSSEEVKVWIVVYDFGKVFTVDERLDK